MPRAVLKNGVIYPLDPLPPEWADGRELRVREVVPEDAEAIDRWAQDMDALCADSDPEDEVRMLAALDETRREAKAQAHREMGLPDEAIYVNANSENP